MMQLSRADAARFLTEKGLPIAATTLAKKAVQGSGPPYRVWNGRATYSVDDLLKWVEAQLGPKLMSTAERDAMMNRWKPLPIGSHGGSSLALAAKRPNKPA
jgi:hypothetical protein